MKKLGILFVIFLLTGCSARLGSLTMMTTKNLGSTPKPLSQQVRGEDCIHQVLGIPLGSLNPNLQEAMDDAIEKSPGANALTDISVHQDMLFLYLYARECVRVDGKTVTFSAINR